jgi:hypothetical protein
MPWFWMTAGPGGWLVSAFLGYRCSKGSGQLDSAFGRILLLPALMLAIGYGILLFSPPYPWTIVGLLGATGLLFSAFAGEASEKKSDREA